MIKHVAFLFVVSAAYGTSATAQEIPLGDYLASMDRTAVSFSGSIKYDRREDTFTFIDEDRAWFSVTVDAGRDTREQIEADCENSGFMVSYSDLCAIAGSGTIEIRGSQIHISVDTVDVLTPVE